MFITMYYKLYDKQTGRDMATGFNATSKKQLSQEYADYKSIDEEDEDKNFFDSASTEQILDRIRRDEFDIETSNRKFKETEL